MDFSAFEAEWHPTKNLPLVFSESLNVTWKYWWLGGCGHEWEATLNKRTGASGGCLVCSSFALVHPEIASEWHPTKNGDLTTVQIGAKASGKYWWLGACGHDWEDYILQRVGGKGCQVCSGKQLLVGANDLATVNPIVASEWHPTKNGKLTPTQVTANSTKDVLWLCSEGHEWETPVKSRGSRDLGCPYCTNRKLLVGFNDFATLHPELTVEWHPNKNESLAPDQFLIVSATKVWWLGGCGHEWEISVASRSKGTGCPYCSNRKLLAGFNDLGTVNPKLASEWHPWQNGDLTPEDILYVATLRVWWRGECGHAWDSSVKSRVKGIGCPTCRNPEPHKEELIVGTNDLASLEPELAAQLHPTKNGKLTSTAILRNYDKPVWWLGDCGYEWEAAPKDRKTTQCPVCVRLRIRYGVNDLFTQSPEVASEWHPTKNGEQTPKHVSFGSERKVWWLGECGHEWEAFIKNRVGKGSRCPVCSGNVILTGFNDLATTEPEIASEWHPTKNGEQAPQNVSATSNFKAWWLGACGHEWQTAVYYRSRGNQCPVCSGQRKFNGRAFLGRSITLGLNSLSAANPEVAAEWHPTKNGEFTPKQVSVSSARKIWWLGACGHEWDTFVYNRTLKGFGCPICSNHRVAIGINDLTTTYPEIASEWHPTKNGELTPQQVTHGSHKKVWWLGECGHEWEYEVRYWVKKNKGCFICK